MMSPQSPRPARSAKCARIASLVLILLAPGLAGAQVRPPAEPDPLLTRPEGEIPHAELAAAAAAAERAIEAEPGRTDLRLRLASLQRRRAMWLKAAEQYRAILALDPKHTAGKLGYAELLLSDYQFKAAEKEFREVLRMSLPHEELDRAQLGLGTALYAEGRYKEAIEGFARVLERHPDDPTANAYTNFARRMLGDLDGAINGWSRFIEQMPGFSRGKIVLDELEHLRASIVRQKTVAKERGDQPEVHRILGDLLMEKPDIQGAITAYSRATELAPQDIRARMRLGVALRTGGHLQAAADLFRTLTREPGVAGVASYNLAWCERRLAGPSAEASAWELAVQSNPEDAYAYHRYVDALLRSGRLEREIGLLLPAIGERPLDPLPRVQFGVLSTRAGHREEGARALLDALSIEPNDPWAQDELREALRASPGLADKLLEDLRSIEKEGGEDPVVSLHRKVALLRAAGRAEECSSRLSEALAAGTADARARVALAGCQRASGASPGRVVETLGPVLSEAPGYAPGRTELAMSLAASRRFVEAAREARAAVALDDTDVRALVTLGLSLREMGGRENLVEAHGVMAHALEIAPMDPTGVARLTKAKLAWQLGNEEEARRLIHGDLPVEPEEVYRLAWEFVRDHYGDRTFNGQDWGSWRDRYAGQLESEVDALGAIAVMLSSLSDPDTGLRSKEQTIAYMFTERSRGVIRSASGRPSASSSSVEAVALEENVGYVAVTNMNDPGLTEKVEEAFDQMEKREAVILDLRGNLGGAEREAEAITSMLVEPGTPTGTLLTEETKVPVASPEDRPPKLPDKPVIVLVDRNTASSAEALAGALKESNRAVVVGEQTYGKAGIQLPHLLPGGTTLMLAAAESGDLEGVSYAGRGIQPDVTVEGSVPAPDKSSDAAITKAKEILRKRRIEKSNGSRGPSER